MKLLMFVLAFFWTALASPEAHLAITQNGKLMGYATVSAQIEKDGSKSVSLRMDLSIQGSSAKITSEARYDARGIPLRKYQQTIVPGGALTKQVIATFTAAGAAVTLLEGDKRAMKEVTLAEAAPRASLSEFWFLRDRPKVGQSEDAYQFNVDSLQWDLTHTTYVGDKAVKVAHRSVTAHQVVATRGDQTTTSYLDDQGLPIIIEQGLVRMERIWPK
jgi:hypothetical protein